jgi:hypothetical protein
MVTSEVQQGRDRARRWWVTTRRVKTLERAAAFIDDVGFALLFPARSVVLPSLWDAVAGDVSKPFGTGMGADEQRVWAWKDELPSRGLAWYGRFLAGRGSFLSPRVLSALYPGDGREDDHARLPLSVEAHEIADALAQRPWTSAELRILVGGRRRYDRAAHELQRHLLVTSAGVRESPTGWPAVLLQLTCQRFDVGGCADRDLVARRFKDTVLQATPRDLARAFGWPLAEATARWKAVEAAQHSSREAG